MFPDLKVPLSNSVKINVAKIRLKNFEIQFQCMFRKLLSPIKKHKERVSARKHAHVLLFQKTLIEKDALK